MARRSLPVRATVYCLISLSVCGQIAITSGLDAAVLAIAYQISYFILVFDSFSYFNLANYNARLNAVSNAIGLTVSIAGRITITFCNLPYKYLSLPIILLSLAPVAIRWRMYRRSRPALQRGDGHFNGAAKAYFVSGIPVFISALSSVAYSQFAGYYLAHTSIVSFAIYTAALSFGSAWAFVPTAVITSFLPEIYAAKSLDGKLSPAALCFGLTLVVGIASAGSAIILGRLLVAHLYSDAYQSARLLVAPISLATLLASLNYLCARVIYHSGGKAFLIKKSLLTLVLAAAVCPPMVSRYGAFGAAFSNVLIEITSLTVLNYFFRGVSVARLQINGVFRSWEACVLTVSDLLGRIPLRRMRK